MLRSCRAPAKLNLNLRVIGRRPDGFHLVDTDMVMIDLADEIEIALRDDGVVARAGGWSGVAESEDLALRAAKALQSAADVRQGAEIAVRKRIPTGAGLGGGSSDAASVLMALDELWGVGAGEDALASLGASLGADVPFFVRGRPARARGIGDELSPLSRPETSGRLHLVVVPDARADTADVYAMHDDLTKDAEAGKIRGCTSDYGNDLEPAATVLHPEISDALAELRSVASAARMTGSGSAVFATFGCREDLDQASARLPVGLARFAAAELDRHPMRGAQE